MNTTTSTNTGCGADQPHEVKGFEAWEAVVRSLRRIVPYIDVEDIDRAALIQDEADLDPLDLVHLMAAVAEETGVLVPERDYPLVATLDSLVDYVARRTP